jgi:hypothetical protein
MILAGSGGVAVLTPGLVQPRSSDDATIQLPFNGTLATTYCHHDCINVSRRVISEMDGGWWDLHA